VRYKLFGPGTGLRVSEVALGTGNFGTGWSPHGSDRDEARRIFDAYLDAGGNFIDTADGYQFGQSETMLGEFIGARRDELVLATKYSSGAASSPTLAKTGNSRKNMIYSVEQSLKRLRTDRIDIFWVHHADNVTSTEEIVRGFDDLVRSGKILYGGISNFPAWRVSHAATVAALRGSTPIIAIQVEYNLIERTADRELFPMSQAFGLGVALWSPLAGGLLTGKYRKSDDGRLKEWGRHVRAERTQRETAIVDALLAVSAELSVDPLAVALAWLLERGRRSGTSMVPILGPRTHEQLVSNLAALNFTLSADHFQRLDDVSAIELGVPHEVNAKTLAPLNGGIPELVDRRTIAVT
jgi:aryl-alcohol dehydrogenase-like predicted oxidoreductase